MPAKVPVPTYRVVLMLIEHQKRYLLIQEAKPHLGNPWYLPAGGVEPGEDLKTAAQRETLEEAGIQILPKYFLEIEHTLPLDLSAENPNPEIWRFFIVAEFIGGSLKKQPDAESFQAQWFSPEEIPKLHLRTPRVLEVLQKYRSGCPLYPIELYQSQVARE
mgnify:FL=1